MAIFPIFSDLNDGVPSIKKIAMVEFFSDKNYKTLSSRDKYQFISWAK